MNEFENVLCDFCRARVDDRIDYATYKGLRSEIGRKNATRVALFVILQLDESALVQAYLVEDNK